MTNPRPAHDTPGHHRSGGAVSEPAPPASRVLRIANATAYGDPGPWSLCRPCGRITHGAGHRLPQPHAPPELTPNPAVRGHNFLRFLAPTSSNTRDRNVKRQVGPDTPYFAPDNAPIKPDAAGAELAYELLMLYLAKQADPSFRIDQHVTPTARPVVRTAQTQCLAEVAQAVTTAHLTDNITFNGDVNAVLGPYFRLMSYDTLTLKGPVFMGVGGADVTVPPQNQQRLAADACAAGSTIELHIYPGLDHSPTVNTSLMDSIPFARKVFAGQPVTGNCLTNGR